MNELALFAGAGGGILGGKLLGWRTVCAVEWEPYPASVLCARQNDGLLPPFPVWDDVQTFDGKPWRGIVDVVSGGFPCQDISAAGKGAGIDGERSGMWGEMARIIHEVRPRFVFVENSPMLTSRGLGRVLGDLASMGFDAKWGVLGAADVGANHKRDRIWICAKWRGQISHAQHNRIRWWEQQQESIEKKNGNLANSSQLFSNGSNNNARISVESKKKFEFGNSIRSRNVADSNLPQFQRKRESIGIQKGFTRIRDSSSMVSDSTSLRQSGQRQHEQSINTKTNQNWQTNYAESIGRPQQWASEPNVGRVADGVAARMDRLKAIGNGQVPLCAATAWRILSGN
jgi:DNA (cytosine-5)-methyltransferase 1